MERVNKVRKPELAELFFIEGAIIVLEMFKAAIILQLAKELVKELEKEERRRNEQG